MKLYYVSEMRMAGTVAFSWRRDLQWPLNVETSGPVSANSTMASQKV
jgi:hypothetical protein